ncbi:MAG: PilN domain-containing protein [Gammaproteobacteria bacterium]
MINLLPWRTHLRRKQRQEFIALLLGVSFIAILLLGLSHRWLSNTIKTTQQAYQQLQIQKSQLEKTIADYQTQQQSYLPVVEGILLLQRCEITQANLLDLLQTIGNLIPSAVYLTQLQQTNRRLELTGIARKHQNITQLMQRLEATEWVKQATLLQSQRVAIPAGVHFKIAVSLIK